LDVVIRKGLKYDARVVLQCSRPRPALLQLLLLTTLM